VMLLYLNNLLVNALELREHISFLGKTKWTAVRVEATGNGS
jgi:hypothetical protein